MRRILGVSFVAPAAFFVVATGITLLVGWHTRFHVTENDFWSVLYYGERISLAEPESLYNGFFPIGYAALIGQFPERQAVELAYVLNALLAGLLVASIADLVAATRSLPATVLAFAGILAAPLVFQYANTVGPDIGAAAFTALAVNVLWRDRLAGRLESRSLVRAGLVGASLGLAFMWRSHASMSAVAILLSLFAVAGIRPLRNRFGIIAAFAAVVSIQLAANLLSGHGLLETAQKLNVYKLLYGVNWSFPPSPADLAEFSLLKVLLSDPRRVLDGYLPVFRSLALLAWPGALCALLAPGSSPISRFGLFAGRATLLYAVPLALGDSPRAPLTIVSLFACGLALAAVSIVERIRTIPGKGRWASNLAMACIVAGSLVPLYGWADRDLALVRESRTQHENFIAIQEKLVAEGMTSPDQLFSNKYQLYMPDLPPYLPRQIGGWGIDWVWGYAAQYPELPNDSWQAFATACREQDIQFMVLTPLSVYQGDFFSLIYDRAYEEDVLGLHFMGRVARMRMYEFTE
jgi:hypothetical protein